MNFIELVVLQKTVILVLGWANVSAWIDLLSASYKSAAVDLSGSVNDLWALL